MNLRDPKRTTGVSPMIAVRRDIGRYSNRLSTSEVGLMRSTASMGETPRVSRTNLSSSRLPSRLRGFAHAFDFAHRPAASPGGAAQ